MHPLKIKPAILSGFLLCSSFFLFSGCNNRKPTLSGEINKLYCSIPKELKKPGETIKVIGVFTTWSIKSQAMMKRFNKIHALINNKKVGFAYILIDHDQRMVDGWYKAYKPEFPVLHDPNFKFCNKKVNNIPLFIIMNSKGKVCYLVESVISSKIMFKMLNQALKNCK